jgi:sec-independent protein translocase protein TatA
MLHPIGLWMPQGAEWLFIAAAALLIFGKRLPEVGRSLGKGIVEFKKGLKGIEDEVETASSERPKLTAQKFDPYTGKPLEQNTTSAPPPSNHA